MEKSLRYDQVIRINREQRLVEKENKPANENKKIGDAISDCRNDSISAFVLLKDLPEELLINRFLVSKEELAEWKNEWRRLSKLKR
jgi:hypothetical protein